jgi:transposase
MGLAVFSKTYGRWIFDSLNADRLKGWCCPYWRRSTTPSAAPAARYCAADQVLAHAYDHVELPPIKPVTTRINVHRADCPCCGKTITAEPPADMPPGSPFGPGIVALVTYVHGCQMVSYARLAEMLEDLFGLKISEGAIANMLARAAEPFAECAQTIHETVRNSPVIASDETSARVTRRSDDPRRARHLLITR